MQPAPIPAPAFEPDPEVGPGPAPEAAAGTAPKAAPEAAPESAKRKQILEGARRRFLASGFEAASMGEIAREAKVSKGTLYVYFDSKEALFAALVEEAKAASADRLHRLDDGEGDVRDDLTRFAAGLIEKLSRPDHIALVRMVVGASEKFPGIARGFFEAGPAYSARGVADYLAEQTRLGALDVADPQAAAWQFLGMCQHPTMVGVMLGAMEPPDAARVAQLSEGVVATFLAAYGPKPR